MNKNKDSLGDRMKDYENISRIYLTKRNPVIIRIDGKAFHTFTRGFMRPFDDTLIKTMQQTMLELCKNIGGCKLGYTQSDEISLLLTDYDTINTQPWFDNNLQKLVSISASLATLKFNQIFRHEVATYGNGLVFNDYEAALNLARDKGAMFDARAFILPKEEVCNYFIWRQQDASRNSIQMIAQSIFSHKELQGKNSDQLQEMIFQKTGKNWNDYYTVYKRGSCCIKSDTEGWNKDTNIPIFTQDREYIDRFVFIEEKND